MRRDIFKSNFRSSFSELPSKMSICNICGPHLRRIPFCCMFSAARKINFLLKRHCLVFVHWFIFHLRVIYRACIYVAYLNDILYCRFCCLLIAFIISHLIKFVNLTFYNVNAVCMTIIKDFCITLRIGTFLCLRKQGCC
jgi:hypothetical protein